ncbi:hypothetical protein WISP_78473 [Willisornis vidua]|uniref:26S proteasome complex subunit SEM1 n=1 Tax=Willisornis vidua TaxID=1566151 RepID=A0ABQ9DBG5_9PASS|nr:hypothetical protein WISP_78473 [Willisornis vidua]
MSRRWAHRPGSAVSLCEGDGNKGWANLAVPHGTKAVQHTVFRAPFLSLDWTGLDEDEDAHVWEDNWDDDNVEDDFSNQLSEIKALNEKEQALVWIYIAPDGGRAAR